MQKVIKRAAQAQRQATRRTQKKMKQAMLSDRMELNRVAQVGTAELRQNIKDARIARKEDWELGPLAPKRDLGAYKKHGAIESYHRHGWGDSMEKFISPAVVEARCRWAGWPNQLNIAVGDRVVIVDGPDKGKIDRIKFIDKGTGTARLHTYHKSLFSYELDDSTAERDIPISIDAIRLVYPLTDPETGNTRDVIIKELKAVRPNMQSENMTYERWEYGKKWDRMVPGLNVVIPWPETGVPKHEAYEVDTSRENVENRSFYYNMLSPPMPTSVLDELRNKYSKHRTRHEPGYVAKKEAEDAQKKRRFEMIETMRTPLDEFHEKQRELRTKAGEPELSEDMLEKLGEIMAKTRAASLKDAGVSEVAKSQSTER